MRLPQTTNIAAEDSPLRYVRTVNIKTPWNGFGDLSDIIGTHYTIVFWHESTTTLSSVVVSSSNPNVSSNNDVGCKATIVTFPVADAHTEHGVTLQLTHNSPV